MTFQSTEIQLKLVLASLVLQAVVTRLPIPELGLVRQGIGTIWMTEIPVETLSALERKRIAFQRALSVISLSSRLINCNESFSKKRSVFQD